MQSPINCQKLPPIKNIPQKYSKMLKNQFYGLTYPAIPSIIKTMVSYPGVKTKQQHKTPAFIR